MRSVDDELLHLLDEGGNVIRTRDRPDLVTTLRRREASGVLTRVLPGTLVPTPLVGDPLTRARAAQAWCKDAVICGDAAARLTFWPELGDDLVVEVALPGRPRCARPGYLLTRRAVPPELVTIRSGLRLTSSALTALDLCRTRDGDGIDRALFRRATTLRHLQRALELTAGRRGNAERAGLLLDSRDEPWAKSERLAHRLLRSNDIRGWQANLRVEIEGNVMFLDIGFDKLRLAIEIDGYEVHTDRGTFEHDRLRQNLLANAGWHVLRFTWLMLVEHPDLVLATIREAIDLLTGNVTSRRPERRV